MKSLFPQRESITAEGNAIAWTEPRARLQPGVYVSGAPYTEMVSHLDGIIHNNLHHQLRFCLNTRLNSSWVIYPKSIFNLSVILVHLSPVRMKAATVVCLDVSAYWTIPNLKRINCSSSLKSNILYIWTLWLYNSVVPKMNLRWTPVCPGKSFAVQEEVPTHNILCNFKREVKFSLGTGIVCLFYFVTAFLKIPWQSWTFRL